MRLAVAGLVAVEDQSLAVEIGLPVAVVVIMIRLGFSLTAEDFRRVCVYP